MEDVGGIGVRVERAGGRGRGFAAGGGGRGGRGFVAGDGDGGGRGAAGGGDRGGRRSDGPAPDVPLFNPNHYQPAITKEDADEINLEKLKHIQDINQDEMVRSYRVSDGLLGQGAWIDNKNTSIAEKLTCLVRNRRVVLVETLERRAGSAVCAKAKLRYSLQYKKVVNLVMDIEMTSRGRAMKVPDTYEHGPRLPVNHSGKAKRKGTGSSGKGK